MNPLAANYTQNAKINVKRLEVSAGASETSEASGASGKVGGKESSAPIDLLSQLLSEKQARRSTIDQAYAAMEQENDDAADELAEKPEPQL